MSSEPRRNVRDWAVRKPMAPPSTTTKTTMATSSSTRVNPLLVRILVLAYGAAIVIERLTGVASSGPVIVTVTLVISPVVPAPVRTTLVTRV